jgi:hypothetical protein
LSERGEAKRDGAKQQKNSGRGKIQKGDATWNGFVVDYKEYSKSISISQVGPITLSLNSYSEQETEKHA